MGDAQKSWLIRDRSKSFAVAGNEQKKAKAGGTAEDEDMDDATVILLMKNLIVQLEARLRLLEHEAMSTAILDRDHQTVVDTNKSYAEYAKERKQNPETNLGSPACQSIYAILTVLDNWQYKDTSARISRLKLVAVRLARMVSQAGPDLTGQWVRETAVFPCFDQPNKPKKSRLLFSLRGSTLVPDDGSTEAELLKAVDDPESLIHQQTPLEVPTSFYTLKGKIMNVESIVAELVRASGGNVTASRAPRGNTARKLMKKYA